MSEENVNGMSAVRHFAIQLMENIPALKKLAGPDWYNTEDKIVDMLFDFSHKYDTEKVDNLKFDHDKARLALVPTAIIKAVGEVRTYGVKKYKEVDSWKKVSPERYRDAMMRHICAYLDDPTGVDEESGLPHIWHIACNVAFLCELEDATKKENSDV